MSDDITNVFVQAILEYTDKDIITIEGVCYYRRDYRDFDRISLDKVMYGQDYLDDRSLNELAWSLGYNLLEIAIVQESNEGHPLYYQEKWVADLLPMSIGR